MSSSSTASNDPCEWTATELLSGYRSGRLSPVEVTRQVLARIERLNPQLNAFTLVDAEQAMASAQASEARWHAHRQRGTAVGALEGVPATIKDLILTRSWPTLRGSHSIDAKQTWDIDAPVTARLRESGAVLLGKTTTPEFGCKGETNSPRSGITRNPWDLNKTPGGSSGGAAAAVAAGLGPLAVGTDGAGSVRIPAAFCGNVGLKPSFGRVPAYPLSPFGSVAHLGPHTLSVADAALMLNVMAQPDARDWTSLPFEGRDYTVGLNDGVRGLRMAYSPRLGHVKNLDPEIAESVERGVEVLRSLGAQVEAVDPGFSDPLHISTGLWFAGAATLWRGLSEAQREKSDPDFAAEAKLGEALDIGHVHALNMERGLLGSQMRQFMTQWDVLVTPSVAVPAFDAKPAGHTPMSPEVMLGWTPYSYPFNLTQQPAITVPCGLTRSGLPIGIQFVGRMFDDAMVLRVAKAFESVVPVARPSLNWA
ncbi:MAG: Acylamidase [Pseudomonadota bacterium]|jgi:aspartyl-tRNA(Asn)/glutamyl-tRNA(Gln) amidotransferase subunit A